MVNLWLILAVIAAPLHWLARLRHWRWLDLITKPLVLLFLIFWSLSITRWEGGMLWFGLALVFSLLGDILLMLPPRVFLGGSGRIFYRPYLVYYRLLFPIHHFTPLIFIGCGCSFALPDRFYR